MDSLLPPLTDTSYRHWGTFTYPDGSTELEPNNLPARQPELCSVGNYTQAYGNDTHNPFGWSDQNCTQRHISICKVSKPGVAPWYTTNSTNITFYLNTSVVGGWGRRPATVRRLCPVAAAVSIQVQLMMWWLKEIEVLMGVMFPRPCYRSTSLRRRPTATALAATWRRIPAWRSRWGWRRALHVH